MIEVSPNSRNVIPGRVFLTIDLRHPNEEKLASMDAALQAGVKAIAEKSGVTMDLVPIWKSPVTEFNATCVTAVRDAAKALGFSHRDITSGAGHDAVYMARVAPTAMIFTPCVDGISHNEAEDMTPAWAAAGTNVLLHAALSRAGIVA